MLALFMLWQCSSGSYSTADASACTVCPAGKYLVNGSVGAEAEACAKVRILNVCSESRMGMQISVHNILVHSMQYTMSAYQ